MLAPTCAAHGCACHDHATWRTLPNVVTLARTAGSLVLALSALAAHSWPLLVAAYAVYWVGDMADGALARATGRETRRGAALDVVCDRVNTVSCALVLLTFVPAWAAVAVFLVQFVVVDMPLTLLTLRWPVLSPNYFALVDPAVHTWNWRPLAKATNTALLVVLLLVVPDHRVALVAACAVLAVKVFCLVRVLRLPAPPPGAHAGDVRALAATRA